MKLKLLIIFGLAILLAVILRTYRISDTPPSLYWDETAVAYNAYSIFHTARDEYGNLLPLIFRSFNDYKMPGFVYLTAPFAGVFGLTEFATRLPSVLAGGASVVVTYLLVMELCQIGAVAHKKRIALLSAFLLGLSPWHLQFSRTGFEANVASMIFLLGFWLFLLGIRKRINLIFSFLAFTISVYFYRSIHGFLPFFLVGLVITFWKDLWAPALKRTFICGGVLLCLLILPIFQITVLNKGSVRFQQVSVIDNPQEALNIKTTNTKLENNFNRYLVYGQDFIKGYFGHFSPDFLFLTGDAFPRHRVTGMGLLYLVELPFLLAGIYYVAKLKEKKIKWILLFWAIFAPIPAAIAIPSPHALRSLNLLPLPQILVAIGIIFLIRKKFLVILLGAVYAACVVYYLNSYYLISAKIYSSIWADGYKQLTSYVFANENEYDKVLITGHQWQPYIYFLFYKNYPPFEFQASGNSYKFDRYVFGPTGWDEGGNQKELKDKDLKKYAGAEEVLVVLSPQEYSDQKDNLKFLKDIYDHNNELVFKIGETK